MRMGWCFFRYSLFLRLKSQVPHWNSFFSLCIRVCFFRLSALWENFSQSIHVSQFLFVASMWAGRCLVRCFAYWNILSQVLLFWMFLNYFMLELFLTSPYFKSSTVWTGRCFFTLAPQIKTLRHVPHLYFLFSNVNHLMLFQVTTSK